MRLFSRLLRSLSLSSILTATAFVIPAHCQAPGQAPAAPARPNPVRATPAPVSARTEVASPRDAYPVQAVVTRRFAAVPATADTLKFALYGDGSGSRLQIRILPVGVTPDSGVYFAAPVVRLDFKGWKTLTLPFKEFAPHSDLNPGATDYLAPLTATNATALQLAITGERAKFFVDDLLWTTADATATTPPLATIDTFNTPTASSWLPTGDFEQQEAVSIGINRLRPFIKSAGSGSLQIVVRAPWAAEREINGSTVDALLKRTPAQPYVAYVREPYTTVTPLSTPTLREAGAKPRVAVFACADQTEPATVIVYAGRNLKEVTLKPGSAFLSESKRTTLPADAFEIHVVKAVGQSGIGPERDSDALYSLPQVLVKDDREPLTGPLPTVRTTGDAVADVAAQTSKQFWITVRVPKGQPPSVYSGTLVLTATGVRPTTIPMTVEVLPMRLRSPFLQYGIDFPARLSGSSAVTVGQLRRSFEDIREHGFRFVSLYDTLPTLGDTMKEYQQAGLSAAGPIVLNVPPPTREDLADLDKARVAAGLGANTDLYFTNANTKVMRRFAPHSQRVATLNRLEDLNDDIDIPIWSASGPYSQSVLQVGKRLQGRRDWWSWSIGTARPRTNRLLTGFQLYRTGLNGPGLYGAFPFSYQFVPAGADPYNEAGGTGTLRPALAAYPVADGVLDTIGWEAAREGVTDIRYITNLKTYIREVKDLKIRKEVTDEAEAYLDIVMRKPLQSLTPAQYQSIRRGLADRSLKLLTILRAKIGIYPD